MRFGIREAIFLLLLLSTPIASYLFLFAPRNAMIQEARTEIRQKQAKLEQLEEATNSIEDLGSEIDKLTDVIEMFERKLPAQREVEVILKQVWELAARNSLKPKSVRTDKPVDAGSYSELPIKMVIIGKFDGFYSFMLELEKLRRITRIPKITLKRITQNTQDQIQADFVLSIFFEPHNADGSSRGLGGDRT